MVAINELLGFRIARQESAWRLDVPLPRQETDRA
jgi:hypothetical protein